MIRPDTKASSIFYDLATAVEVVGEREVQALLRSIVTNRSARSTENSPSKRKGGNSSSLRLQLISSTEANLQRATTREAAKQVIEVAGLNRRELESLARSIDVPVRKDMKVGDIEDLIVNMTVGGRLNSLAIRGS